MARKAIAVVDQGALTQSQRRRLVDLGRAVGTVQHPGQPLRYNLPVGWTLPPSDLEDAKNLLSILMPMIDPASDFEIEPGRFAPAAQSKGALLTKMIRGLAGPAETSAVAAASKIEMYADAVEDLPAWTIDKAIKRWARGECPASIEETPRYAFPPAPATLRSLAREELAGPKRDAELLQRLIAAVPIEEAMDPARVPTTPNLPALRRM